MTSPPVPQAEIAHDAVAASDLRVATQDEIRALSRINSWTFAGAALLEYAVIGVAVWLSWTHWSIASYLLAICLIGPRIHALGALMHEASHYRAFRNRRLNDIVGEIVAFSTTASLEGYRKNHFAHHRNLNTDDDPDFVRNLLTGEFVFPKPLRDILWTLVRYGTGGKTWATYRDFHQTKEVKEVSTGLMVARSLVLVALIGASIVYGFWPLLLLYWVVPIMTTFQVVRYIRNVAEHVALERYPLAERTRTVVAPWFEQWMIAPYGLNYHVEHHLYPGVTCFNLARLHAILMTREPFRSRAHITHGYVTGLLRECMTDAPSARGTTAQAAG